MFGGLLRGEMTFIAVTTAQKRLAEFAHASGGWRSISPPLAMSKPFPNLLDATSTGPPQ
jgi:hypothetical protein